MKRVGLGRKRGGGRKRGLRKREKRGDYEKLTQLWRLVNSKSCRVSQIGDPGETLV